MTKFSSNFDVTHPFSDAGAKMQLATNVALAWTVPGTIVNKYKASFSYTSDSSVWVAYNVTAVAPVAGTLVDSYKEEFKPAERYVNGGDVLSFIASVGTPQVGVSLLDLPNPRQ